MTLARMNRHLLSLQKAALIAAINDLRNPAQIVLFEGLLSFIDAVQDEAASHGLPVVWLSK